MSGERAQRNRHNAVEDYQQTVKALLAFAALVVHDGSEERPDAQFGLGRRMSCSENNPVVPADEETTPDLVAQKSERFGVVVEAKKSLSREAKAALSELLGRAVAPRELPPAGPEPRGAVPR